MNIIITPVAGSPSFLKVLCRDLGNLKENVGPLGIKKQMAKSDFQPFTTEVLFSPMPLKSVLLAFPLFCLPIKLYLTL